MHNQILKKFKNMILNNTAWNSLNFYLNFVAEMN